MTLMPFAVSALQLSDRMKQRLGRVAGWGLLAMVAGLVVAVPTTLYWQYRYGAFQVSDNVITRTVVAATFHNSASVTRTLEAQGSLGLSESLGGWQRFAHVSPEPKLVTAFLCTFCLVLLFRFLRHRFAWWPLHPLIFVVLGTLQTRSLAFSFLLGWGLKKLVTKYGGAALYHRLKPLMIGLVAGEVMAGLIPIIVGAIYYLVTGTPPKPFRILPF